MVSLGVLARKFFGSANDRRIKSTRPRVEAINAMENELRALSDAELSARTEQFRADLANGGPSKMAGSITAALYLERFVPPQQKWAHVDVYAWNDSDRPGKPTGGEAQGLRAAFALLQAQARR